MLCSSGIHMTENVRNGRSYFAKIEGFGEINTAEAIAVILSAIQRYHQS